MVPTEEELEALYAEFADDDVELSEAGLADYVAGFPGACAKLDPTKEQALAEIGVNADLADWPEY